MRSYLMIVSLRSIVQWDDIGFVYSYSTGDRDLNSAILACSAANIIVRYQTAVRYSRPRIPSVALLMGYQGTQYINLLTSSVPSITPNGLQY